MKTIQNLADLDLNDVFSQANYYTPECFEVIDGMLIAETLWRKGCADYSRFIVGPVGGTWELREARCNGAVVATNERNTGWGFVAQD